MIVQVLVDNPNSWIVPYAEQLVVELIRLDIEAVLLHDKQAVIEGDILCLLSCEQLFKKLHLNRHNLVIHESELPKGKGWSPMTWQILEGRNEIPITLFEAAEKVDSGDVYARDVLRFSGHELLPELKRAQGEKTIKMILDFCEKYPNVTATPQVGGDSYYARRTKESSVLDLDKTLSEQFNLLRVCDNERYPAFFEKEGIRYEIKINKIE